MAFEPIRVAWPTERLIHVDDRVLVVDKPLGLPVHGGSPDVDDVVTRLGRLLSERGESEYLSVHSRLDKDVSGVLLFGREPADNAAISREFEARRVEKHYLAVVRDSGLPSRFEMRDELRPTERGRTRVVGSGGQEAVTEVTVRARQRGRALVELRPKTGRRHQLRAQLAHRGAAICGDALYQGEPANRLFLHAIRLESKSLGWHFESAAPAEFFELGLFGALGVRDALARSLFDAAWLREPLFRSTEVLRLVNAAGDGLPGVAVDRYCDWAVLELSTDAAIERRHELGELVFRLGARGVYTKCRMRRDLRRESTDELASDRPDFGEPAPPALTVRENELPIEVRLADGWDVGVYLDQRENRRRVRAAAADRSVLNLFGYTGLFSVAAALGGAARTTTIDISGRALERARRNFELAGLESSEKHQFLRADVMSWLRRARRSEPRYDLVILDPPTFSTLGRGKVFRLGDRWAELLTDTLGLLNPSGQMLVVSHEKGAGRSDLRRRIQQAAAGVGIEVQRIRDLSSPIDVPDGPDGPWPSYALWVELG